MRHFPSISGELNDISYLKVYSVDTMVIDGKESKGYRLYGDGGLRPWTHPTLARHLR